MAGLKPSQECGRIVVLYLDNDGGWGGSARSLGFLLENIDRKKIEPIVILRKPGPLKDRCAALNIDCRIASDLPAFRPGERKTFIAFAIYHWKLLKTRLKLLDRIIEEHSVDIIHVNHESLALAGRSLARRHSIPWVAHIRTQLHAGLLSRWLYRRINRESSAVVFIAEPVRDHFVGLVGQEFYPAKAHVVHNVVLTAESGGPLSALSEPPGRFRVLSLSNFSPNRGVDRIVDVASELLKRGETGFAFYLCGRPANRSVLTGRVVPYYDQIVECVSDLGLSDMVFFPGHVSEPERALAACDALVKLTRQSNPWGRDIMEAMGAGLPVLTIGTYQGFVKDGVNGFVDAEFDPARVADHLCALKADPDLHARMASANRLKSSRLFDGPARSRDIEAIYEQVLGTGDTHDLSAAPAA